METSPLPPHPLLGDFMAQQQEENIENFQYSVNYALPLSNHDNYNLMAIAAFYGFLFVLGTCGNAAILAVVHYVRANENNRNRHNTTLTYICVLCVVDFVSMLPLPMTILDQILGFWMFGTAACKAFRLLEHIGKIFSTFILVAFSIDRYLAVCHPLKIRDHKLGFRVLGAMLVFTFIMLLPILLFAHSKELIIYEKVDVANKSVTRMHLFKCVDDLGDKLFILFTLYCFAMGYLLPLFAMMFFYYKMLYKLYKQATAVRQSLAGKVDGAIPYGHIAVYTLVIVLFHFICWTPYWASVMFSLYIEIMDPAQMLETPAPKFVYFMYGVHALPYINSSCNFILYGLLNRQLHQTAAERSKNHTRHIRTNGAAAPQLRLTECSANHHSAVADTRTPPSGLSTGMESSPLMMKVSITSKNSIVTKDAASHCSTEEAIV